MPDDARSAAISVAVRSIPKDGNGSAENDDSYAADVARSRFVVSDGATLTARPEIWSELLTERYLSLGDEILGPDSRRALAEDWARRVLMPDLPWHARAKLREVGAGATLTALNLCAENHRYDVMAVGDSCFFQIRACRIVRSFPIESSADFGNHPDLIMSSTPTSDLRVHRTSGTYAPGDQLVLATDAFAQFLLLVSERREERRVPDPRTLVKDEHQFALYIAIHRRLRRIKNDDVTVCVVEV